MHHSYDGICFDLYGTLVEDRGIAAAGAVALLDALKDHRIAVVTSAPRRAALAMLRAAKLNIPRVVIADDDVEHGKSAPDPYALAVARLGTAPARSLAVEDTASGVASAKAAGLDAAFLLNGRMASACPAADFYLTALRMLRVETREGHTIAVAFE